MKQKILKVFLTAFVVIAFLFAFMSKSVTGIGGTSSEPIMTALALMSCFPVMICQVNESLKKKKGASLK